MTHSPAIPGSLAGYRLVRKLGDGARSEVYLGSSGANPVEPSVAVKLFRPNTDADSITRELSVLSHDLPAHCARLLDVAQAPDGRPLFVLSRVDRGSIARLLHIRGSITVGESVTLVAPLAQMLSDLHGRGIAHGAIGPRTVHLSQQGEPVLIGFGHATQFPATASDAVRETIAAVSTDRTGLAHLATLVLRSVEDAPGPDHLQELVDWIEQSTSLDTFPAELAERLFDLADPVPIDFSTDRSGPAERNGERSAIRPTRAGLVPTTAVPGTVAGSTVAVSARTPGRWNARADVFLGESPLEQLRPRLSRAVAAIPRRVWFVAAGVTLAVVAFFVLAPDYREGEEGGPSRGNADAGTDTSGSRAMVADTDDPIEATIAILDARSRCIEERSVLCLESVDHAGSSAMQDDRDLIAEHLNGTAVSPMVQYLPEDFRLVERLGDAALVAVGPQSQPASALIIRTEAGWRLRELLVG